MRQPDLSVLVPIYMLGLSTLKWGSTTDAVGLKVRADGRRFQFCADMSL